MRGIAESAGLGLIMAFAVVVVGWLLVGERLDSVPFLVWFFVGATASLAIDLFDYRTKDKGK